MHQVDEDVRPLVVSRRTVLTPEVVLVELADPHGADLPDWNPGSHVDLLLPGDLVRQYSLCSEPADRSTWKIGVLREPQSRGGSEFVHVSLNEGDIVNTRGPRNHFPFDATGRVVFIGGGIGITPLIPMMAAASERGLDWELHYGGRSRGTMSFSDELLGLYGERIHLVPQDEVGLIDLKTILGAPQAGTSVYCCGPEPLLDAVEAMCESWPAGSLHVERFAPRTVDETIQDEEFEVELSITGSVVRIPADRSILTILEDEQVPVVASCYEGTCGSCETPVLGGVPDHRDSVLSVSERAKNDTMMICVSRSRGPKLVLEL